MLHVTNGDSAVNQLRAAGFGDDILPWRDVLHEGPVPAGLDDEGLREMRAGFLSAHGWVTYEDAWLGLKHRDESLHRAAVESDEIVLWFEHDLYDQLQLIQILDMLAGIEKRGARLSLICEAEYVSSITPEIARERFTRRAGVKKDQLHLAQKAWYAFRSPEPFAVEEMASDEIPEFPFLRDALIRHLEQFPSTANGLARSEQQALGVISRGKSVLKEIYLASHHEQEDPIFLGDTIFATYLVGLSRGDHPLVVTEGGTKLEPPPMSPSDYWNQRVVLTDTGREVLEGRADWIKLNGIDRWYGGVHQYGADALYRWDTANRKIIASVN